MGCFASSALSCCSVILIIDVSFIWIPSDVLLGRGSGCNNHIGNIRFREYVDKYQDEYHNSCKSDKPLVALKIVYLWKNLDPYNGRFLTKMNNTNSGATTGGRNSISYYQEVDDSVAMKKVAQRLREGKGQLLTGTSSASSSPRSSFTISNSSMSKLKIQEDVQQHRRSNSYNFAVGGVEGMYNNNKSDPSVKKSSSFTMVYNDCQQAITNSNNNNIADEVSRSLAALSAFFESTAPSSSSSTSLSTSVSSSSTPTPALADEFTTATGDVEEEDGDNTTMPPNAALLVEFFESV